MKKLHYLIPAVILMLTVGCSETGQKTEPPQPAQQQQGAPAPAPQAQQPESGKQIIENYATGLTNAPDKARGAQGRIDLGAVKDAIRNYQVENGRYPDSLEAVKSYLRPETDLGAFNYDPSTGNVTLK